ncbi:hypothetical protein BDZ89DRAFT_1215334, partial [Hymenopellis radicata]
YTSSGPSFYRISTESQLSVHSLVVKRHIPADSFHEFDFLISARRSDYVQAVHLCE